MQGYNNLPPQGFNAPPQGIQSQGYNPNAYPYNAAAAAFNYYNAPEYPCNQFTNPAAFGQGQQAPRLRDKIKNMLRFGKPQPQVLLGPDGHPLPSAYIPPNEPNARRQRYVQDKANIEDFLGRVDFQRANIVPHKNYHGGEFQATAGPVAGVYGPAPFPQSTGLGFNPNAGGPGPYPQNASGPFIQQGLPPQSLPPQALPPQSLPPQGLPSQGQFQGSMYQQRMMQPGSPMRADFAPAPMAGGMERTKVEVKNIPGGFEEKKETFRREENITKASKPNDDKTMTEKIQDKVSDAKEWVSDKLSGPGETKESKLADGMAKPERVGKDLVETEKKNTNEIIDKGQRANH